MNEGPTRLAWSLRDFAEGSGTDGSDQGTRSEEARNFPAAQQDTELERL